MLGAIVLAGGPSSRFGRKNKALIEFGGKPLVRHVVDQCRLVAQEIIVTIGKDERPESYVKALPSKVRLVKDTGEPKSPLNGIAAGIWQLDTAYCLIVPCDTPFVGSNILALLSEKKSGFDLVVPLWPNGYIEPLHAVCRVESTRRVLPQVLKNPGSRVADFIFALDSVRYVSTEEMRKLDPDLRCFLNINSPQDLELAENTLEHPNVSITI